MKRAIVIPIFLVLMSGCQSVPATNYDYSETARFGDYQTFSWLAKNPVGFHKTMEAHVSPLIGQHLKEAAISAFADAGLRYVEDPTDADVLMAFTVGSRERIVANGYNGYFGYAILGDETATGYWYDNNQNLGSFVDGQICVDLFDRKTGQPVWHGTAEESLSEPELDYWRERIPTILDHIARGYPPELPRQSLVMTDVADPHQDKLKVRLHRIEGQVRGIAKMIEEDRPAYDILMQLRAVRAALTSVSGVVATQYLNNQVSELVKSKRRSVQEQEVERLVSELQLFFKGQFSKAARGQFTGRRVSERWAA